MCGASNDAAAARCAACGALLPRPAGVRGLDTDPLAVRDVEVVGVDNGVWPRIQRAGALAGDAPLVVVRD